jgi:hypothetical protein
VVPLLEQPETTSMAAAPITLRAAPDERPGRAGT